jgi:hypothetical protein
LKKWAVAIGVVAIFIGIILAPSSGISQEAKSGNTIDSVELEWSVQGHFKHNDILAVDFSPNHDWSLPMFLPEDVLPAVKYFHINITDPVSKNYTLIEATLSPPMGSAVQPPYNYLLSLVDFTVTHHGALIEEKNPTTSAGFGIECGTVMDEGLYTVNCSIDPSVVIDKDVNGTTYHHPAGPPSQLRLSELVAHTEFPNFYLLPSGISAIAVGAVLSVWGARSGRRASLRHARGKTALTRKT